MKRFRHKLIKIIFIFTLSCIIYVQTQTAATSQQITVDISKVTANIVHNPVGINLNFL